MESKRIAAYLPHLCVLVEVLVFTSEPAQKEDQWPLVARCPEAPHRRPPLLAIRLHERDWIATCDEQHGGCNVVAAMRNDGGTRSSGGAGCFGRDERSPCAGADVVAVSI